MGSDLLACQRLERALEFGLVVDLQRPLDLLEGVGVGIVVQHEYAHLLRVDIELLLLVPKSGLQICTPT